MSHDFVLLKLASFGGLRGDYGAIEALGRLLRIHDVGEDQRAADAEGRVAGVDPVGWVHRGGVLQLIGFAGDGGDQDGDVCGIEDGEKLEGGNLVGGREEGNGEFEDRADAVCSAEDGGAVEIAVTALDQGVLRESAVGTAGEHVQVGEAARRSDPENGAVLARPAQVARPIEIAIAAQDERGPWIAAVGAAERVQIGHAPARCDSKDHTGSAGTAGVGCAVEIAVGSFDKGSSWTGSIGTAERVQVGQAARRE